MKQRPCKRPAPALSHENEMRKRAALEERWHMFGRTADLMQLVLSQTVIPLKTLLRWRRVNKHWSDVITQRILPRWVLTDFGKADRCHLPRFARRLRPMLQRVSVGYIPSATEIAHMEPIDMMRISQLYEKLKLWSQLFCWAVRCGEPHRRTCARDDPTRTCDTYFPCQPAIFALKTAYRHARVSEHAILVLAAEIPLCSLEHCLKNNLCPWLSMSDGHAETKRTVTFERLKQLCKLRVELAALDPHEAKFELAKWLRNPPTHY